MILMDLNDENHDFKFSGLMQKAFVFLKNLDNTAEDGEIEISGRDLYAVIATAETQDPKERFYEAHDEYVDIHLVLQGEQIIKWLPVNKFSPVEYNSDNDFYKFEENLPGSEIRMQDKNIAIFYPGDAHMPLCKIDKEMEIRVCVVKVKFK